MQFVRNVVGASILLVAGTVGADEAAEKAAVTAADSWLKVIDADQYAASWDAAAQLFKNAMSKADWEKSLKSVRSPLGKTVSRKMVSKKYAESLPGTPDRKYVVVQYEASYENKKSATETVTPMLDKDGQWRVSGYYIK